MKQSVWGSFERPRGRACSRTAVLDLDLVCGYTYVSFNVTTDFRRLIIKMYWGPIWSMGSVMWVRTLIWRAFAPTRTFPKTKWVFMRNWSVLEVRQIHRILPVKIIIRILDLTPENPREQRYVYSSAALAVLEYTLSCSATREYMNDGATYKYSCVYI